MKTPHLASLLALALLAGAPTFAATLDPQEVDVSSVENLRPALPIIPERTFTLTDFGAIGDGATLST